MKLSVLVCTIPSRVVLLNNLLQQLHWQTRLRPDVEVLWLGDNKKRSIGAKRNALMDMARGTHFAFIDDDDRVADDYVESILAALARVPDADVVVFDTITHRADLGTHKRNKVGIEYGRTETDDLVTCPPTHTMVWRRELVLATSWMDQGYGPVMFPDKSQGEDVDWVDRVVPLVRKQVRIDKVLYHYDYDPKVSERP